MTISFADGTVVDAILLSRGKDEIRIVIAGGEDAIMLTRDGGNWASEDGESVGVEFLWQRRRPTNVFLCEADYTCSKALALQLNSRLWFWASSARRDATDRLFVLSADAPRVRTFLVN